MAWDTTNQQWLTFPISPPGGELVEAVRLTRLVSVQRAGLGEDGLVLSSSLFSGIQVMMIKHHSFSRWSVLLWNCLHCARGGL